MEKVSTESELEQKADRETGATWTTVHFTGVKRLNTTFPDGTFTNAVCQTISRLN